MVQQEVPEPIREGCDDYWTWNKKHKANEVRLHGNRGETAHFHPNWSNGTAAVRGTRRLNYGRHYWEIKVSQRIFGTSMMFGVGTKKARLHVDAFVNLLGEDGESWGLSHKGLIWHNAKCMQYCNPFRENESTVIGILFDWNNGTLSYYKDGEDMGVAFEGLNRCQDSLYPIVCSTAAKTEMTLGKRRRSFFNLQDRCRATIISKLRQENEIDSLPLPNCIRTFVKEILH
ncbi:hypothetical protein CHS0354_008754 [Potamilus streckersoni]|uniref:SPRY domain-containing SOCS box protein 3 n=1 Tax=Potamilus streckersoni TaxID=2493646 RepID=A0AAE0SEW7_9BIVA|nr:hypothetical protein CHS0354_008754 [Potamilus streckersoni]